ncbi:MAG: hypothetical protein JWO19_4738 [Bryobacterales bacterium]|nr:hypothetical protein [Bryobacterales bacterium]
MVAISAALLIPCVWQERIQAGDLSSHVYNAWLAGQVDSGLVKGLTVTPLWTNVLTDWALQRLLYTAGPVAAERMVSGVAVLIFFWGAFFAVDASTGRRPWLFAPLLAMLSYGLIFHLGFLNFYLSAGFCFWILGLLWRPSRARALAAIPLVILAWLAHALPVIWVGSVLAYLYIVRRIPTPWRIAAPVGGVALIAALQSILMSRYLYRWSLDQALSLSGIAGITGVEQIWLYDVKYLVLSAAILIVLLALFLERIDQGDLLNDPVGQIWSLHVVALVLMPSAIQLPQYKHVFAYIPQRLSLLTALFFIIMVGRARHGRGITRLTGLVATVFFTCLYLDGLAFNRTESEVASLVQNLPRGQRVVAAISDSGARLNAMLHVADRACIGRCFSYGNYEPATAQFRIRITGPNGVVAPDMKVVQEIEEGQHIVTAAEEPLYSVCPLAADPNRFYLRLLHAGEQTCAFSQAISVRVWAAGLPSALAGSGPN